MPREGEAKRPTYMIDAHKLAGVYRKAAIPLARGHSSLDSVLPPMPAAVDRMSCPSEGAPARLKLL